MSRVLSRTRTAAALSVVALAFAACGTGASQPPAGSPTAPPEGTILVEASEYKFDPSAITVAAGAVTFSVKNVGTVEHEFEIFEGETVVDEVEGLVPGLTKDLTVTLEAGDYTFVCKLAGHEEQGMTGTLTVTGS
jgi:iron uptake system component EfeO